MARKIQDTPQIREITEFFIPYDSYDGRIFQDWELEMIFNDYINSNEAKSFIMS